ncbi:hydroxyacid dehydrogenase [Oculatella sp. LEGE 06141]|uniref:NAD(P)-dependent oxidoreductase n=1 Tax=Oculatella sp. LEGE 06141 TaxID=1828648 RepID=UPI00188263D0|nr:hydroxyacid dehydrogenase [Oculatella sp. LEGE 06141]MBE9178198.1 hydroxyacid dehydrogenase [Oculatella sp. LEGE 06141]
MNIAVPDYIDLLESDKAQLRTLGAVTIYDDTPDSDTEIIQRIAGAELITASWVDITAPIIQSNSNLKYIVVPAVGYDQVDVQAATQAGIKVINCPTHNALAVAEYTVGLILALSRQILPASAALRQGKWQPYDYLGTELKGKTVCLVGYGTIGREFATLAAALGMTVHSASSKTTSDELDTLIAAADILSLHVPLTPQTRHLIDARRLELMKPSAYLINTSRGAIADQTALLAALKQNQIAGAALDVFENEPVTGSPNAEILELATLDNVVATPHIAYNTEESRIRLGQELIVNIQACINGNPMNLVN